jgi:hypothetical protein
MDFAPGSVTENRQNALTAKKKADISGDRTRTEDHLRQRSVRVDGLLCDSYHGLWGWQCCIE